MCFLLNKTDFEKIYNDKIRPPLVIFFKNAKKITTTKSSANFLSPKPNGQGSKLIFYFETNFDTYFCIVGCDEHGVEIRIPN